MLKLCRVAKVKVLFLVLVFVFNFDLFKFSAAILEKGLLRGFIFFMEAGEENKPVRGLLILAKPLLVYIDYPPMP